MEMATIGQIQEFEPEKEKVTAYLERVQMFLLANSIKDDKKVPVLLSVIGGKTYALLSSLLAPQKPKDKTFAELSDVLQKHFEPKPVVIVQRFHFYRRNQAPGESVADYMAELRRLATHCKFEGEGHLDEALRDRLVCGLSSEGVQKRLLTYADLTLAKAVEVAQGMEAAERDMQEMKTTELTVRKVSTPSGAVNAKPCYRCGKEGHEPHSCGFKEAICYNCQKRGHLARVCRSKAQSDKGGRTSWRPSKGRQGPVKWVGMSEDKENGVKHLRSAPYHPSTNGLAERFVQSLKQALKVGERRGVPSQQCLAEFLLTYRVTPHATTNESPSKLLMGRDLRTRLDLLHPDCGSTVLDHQTQQKQQHDRHSRERVFHVGQSVMVRNFREGPRWVQAVIVERGGPLSYLVQTLEGKVWKRHIDHVKIVSESTAVEPESNSKDDCDQVLPETFPEDPGETNDCTAPLNPPPESTSESGAPQTIRKSSRTHRPPDRLTF